MGWTCQSHRRHQTPRGLAEAGDDGEVTVIWRKLSLGMASEAGSRFVERLLSVVETCRQRGRSVASYLTACFQAKRGGEPIPSPLA